MEKLAKVFITGTPSIRNAMKQLSENAMQILVVVDKDRRLKGTITDGDIRRALLNNINLNYPISRIANKAPKFLYEHEKDGAVELMKRHSIIHVPILNKKNQVVDIVMWKDREGADNLSNYPKRDNIVFIFAGGAGSRLDPFTKILPKPLIPINEKPIIEVVMDNFRKYNFNNFVLSLNYKAPMIKLYFKDNPLGFKIKYVEEKEFLGTAGSLGMIKNKADKTVLVSNCDVILDIDFNELLEYHARAKNDFTIVGIVRHIKIPYGVMKAKDGNLLDIVEKPEYDFIVNGGTYIIEPKVLDVIGKGEKINMPDLIMKAKKRGFKIGVYPISANWIDIGEWGEYKKALDHFAIQS